MSARQLRTHKEIMNFTDVQTGGFYIVFAQREGYNFNPGNAQLLSSMKILISISPLRRPRRVPFKILTATAKPISLFTARQPEFGIV